MSQLARWLLCPGLLGALLLPGLVCVQPVQARAERLVLAFYYAWFDEKTWTSSLVPDTPVAPYNSDDPAAMARHIEQAKEAGIDALVLNWWGKGNRTEKNLRAMLDIAGQKGFRVAVDFDFRNSPVMHGSADYAEHLRHLHTVHAAHPAYLRCEGRPVVFFFNVSALPVRAWQSLRDQVDPDRQALWIAEGTELDYLSVFDGHHLYSVAWSNQIPPSQTLPKWGDRVRTYNRERNAAKLWVATVMPGYDDRLARPATGFAHSRAGGEYYRQCWQAALDSRPDWVVITSFNEWLEGTYIEPSQSYGRLYLDLTDEWSARFRDAKFSEAATPLLSAASVTPELSPSTTPALPTPELVVEEWPLDQGGPLRDGCGYVTISEEGLRFWRCCRLADMAIGSRLLLIR